MWQSVRKAGNLEGGVVCVCGWGGELGRGARVKSLHTVYIIKAISMRDSTHLKP
jgi:hypothetical protein